MCVLGGLRFRSGRGQGGSLHLQTSALVISVAYRKGVSLTIMFVGAETCPDFSRERILHLLHKSGSVLIVGRHLDRPLPTVILIEYVDIACHRTVMGELSDM